MNSNSLKSIILVVVILYFLAPDPFPGPIDDIIVTILGITARNNLSE